MVVEGIAQVTGDRVQFMIRQIRPDTAGDFDRAGIRCLRLFQVICLQQAAQDPRIEDGVMGDQDASFQVRPDTVPQGIEFRFMGDLVRRDAMNLDIARIKTHERRLNKRITFFDTAVIIHGDCCQGTGAVGIFIGRFKVNSRKIEHNLPSFLTNE